METFFAAKSGCGGVFDVFGRVVEEILHIIGRTHIFCSLVSGWGSRAVDSVAGFGNTFVPESPVEPRSDNCSFGGVPVGVVSVAGFFGEPVVDTIDVLQRFQGIHQITDELVLTGFGARPSVLGVGVDALLRPVLEIVGALNNLHAFVGEPGSKVVESVHQIVLVALVFHLFGGQIAVPEGIVAETDHIKIHVVVDQFVVVKRIVSAVGGTVCVNNDLCVRTEFAHGVATRFEKVEIAVPVVSRFVVRVNLYSAEPVHNLVAHLHKIWLGTGRDERVEHTAGISIYAVCHYRV